MRQASRQLLTVTEVAELLSLKEATIRKRVLQRTIPYVKIGRAVRIPIEAVESICKSGYRHPVQN